MTLFDPLAGPGEAIHGACPQLPCGFYRGLCILHLGYGLGDLGPWVTPQGQKKNFFFSKK